MKVLAISLATISPELKNTITRPPKNNGAIKSFVSHNEDQSIMIPIVAKIQTLETSHIWDQSGQALRGSI